MKKEMILLVVLAAAALAAGGCPEARPRPAAPGEIVEGLPSPVTAEPGAEESPTLVAKELPPAEPPTPGSFTGDMNIPPVTAWTVEVDLADEPEQPVPEPAEEPAEEPLAGPGEGMVAPAVPPEQPQGGFFPVEPEPEPDVVEAIPILIGGYRVAPQPEATPADPLPAPAAAVPDLTGLWRGRYSYPDGRADVEFSLDIQAAEGNRFTGRLTEPNTFGAPGEVKLYADVEGWIDGENRVVFNKTYDGTGGEDHLVRYEGALEESAGRVSGRWILPWGSAAFVMERQ